MTSIRVTVMVLMYAHAMMWAFLALQVVFYGLLLQQASFKNALALAAAFGFGAYLYLIAGVIFERKQLQPYLNWLQDSLTIAMVVIIAFLPPSL